MVNDLAEAMKALDGKKNLPSAKCMKIGAPTERKAALWTVHVQPAARSCLGRRVSLKYRRPAERQRARATKKDRKAALYVMWTQHSSHW